MTGSYIIQTLLIPIIGYIADKKGNRSKMLILQTIIVASSCTIFAFYRNCSTKNPCYIVPLFSLALFSISSAL